MTAASQPQVDGLEEPAQMNIHEYQAKAVLQRIRRAGLEGRRRC